MLRTFRPALAALALLGPIAACVPAPPPSVTVAPSHPDIRVHDARSGADTGFDALVDAALAADVVFLGELHDDSLGHEVQRRLLGALADRGARVTLAMEMFERDVQSLLDAYVTDRASEADFLAGSRPWPNYATDYRPMVELARQRHWRVIASNVPRPIASAVARGGLAVLDTLPADRRAHAAADVQCPDDAYRRKFVALMGGSAGHGGPPPSPGDTPPVERYYQAQCLKDETMAEAIVAALPAAAGGPLVHVNGSFHSDAKLGVPARVLRRRPGTRILVVSQLRVPDPHAADVAAYRARGDFIVLTRERPD